MTECYELSLPLNEWYFAPKWVVFCPQMGGIFEGFCPQMSGILWRLLNP